jgi:hypothetical protein
MAAASRFRPHYLGNAPRAISPPYGQFLPIGEPNSSSLDDLISTVRDLDNCLAPRADSVAASPFFLQLVPLFDDIDLFHADVDAKRGRKCHLVADWSPVRQVLENLFGSVSI